MYQLFEILGVFSVGFLFLGLVFYIHHWGGPCTNPTCKSLRNWRIWKRIPDSTNPRAFTRQEYIVCAECKNQVVGQSQTELEPH